MLLQSRCCHQDIQSPLRGSQGQRVSLLLSSNNGNPACSCDDAHYWRKEGARVDLADGTDTGLFSNSIMLVRKFAQT